MNDERLAEIEARAHAVLEPKERPGCRWYASLNVHPAVRDYPVAYAATGPLRYDVLTDPKEQVHKDIAFIEQAPNDILELVDVIRALKGDRP